MHIFNFLISNSFTMVILFIIDLPIDERVERVLNNTKFSSGLADVELWLCCFLLSVFPIVERMLSVRIIVGEFLLYPKETRKASG